MEELNMSSVYDEYFRRAIGLAKVYVKDEDTAKDVAQEAMIKVWKKQNVFNKARGTFEKWVLKIVKNTALDKQRSQTLRIILKEDDAGLQYFECPCIDLDTIDLETNLNKLEPKLRIPLYLSFIKGHTQEKIAELTNTPLGTVKTRIRTGLIELRKIYT